MSIDLMHVRDANRGRFSTTGPLASAALGRLRQMRGEHPTEGALPRLEGGLQNVRLPPLSRKRLNKRSSS